jgi:hypothetical protein
VKNWVGRVTGSTGFFRPYYISFQPMLERVRMHPQLVTGSKEKEMSTSRWKTMEIHDITIECAKMSLDMIEGTAEGHRRPLFPMFGKRTSVDSIFWMEPPPTPLGMIF